METLGEIIRNLRQESSMPLRKLAALLDIDQSSLSKIERNERKANIKIIKNIANIFNKDEKELRIHFLSDKIYYELMNEDCSQEVLKVAEQKLTYHSQNK